MTTPFRIKNGAVITGSLYVNGILINPVESKSVSMLLPEVDDNITIFHTDIARTISKVVTVLRGADSPSITWTLNYGPDRSAAGTAVITGGTTTSSETTGLVTTTFNNSSLGANNFLWLTITAVDTVDEFHITVYYQ